LFSRAPRTRTKPDESGGRAAESAELDVIGSTLGRPFANADSGARH
jgi:hypothetical protein